MTIEHNVAIVGAGPYGLSLASHLNDRDIDFCVIGQPMQFWRCHMPRGMHLKSDGFASNLYDPKTSYTLRDYCHQHGVEYDDTTLPVQLETFIRYGVEFQKRFAPAVRESSVQSIKIIPTGFSLSLGSGEHIRARKVVVAAGIRDFRHIPLSLQSLPAQFVTHSCDHHDLSSFETRDVVVLGAGASATDIAALLQDSGAKVQLVARGRVVRFHGAANAKRPILQRLRHPSSGIGPGLRSRFYCDAPWLFHHFPEHLRLQIVRRTLGPAGGWFMRERVVGRIPMLVEHSLEHIEIKRDRIYLKLRGPDAKRQDLVADHVVAATGYKSDLQRFQFLSADIRSALRSVDGTPILSSSMESSIPGLYFTGAIAANSFGPVMRFAFGARFAAQLLSRVLV